MVRPFYRNIRLLILTIVMIIAWGISSFQSLPRQEDPELMDRAVVIQTAYPGANAERVEALVTEPLEAELSEIKEIKTLESDSRVGFSTVIIELVDQITDPEPIWSKVRDKMGDADLQFPSGSAEPELHEFRIKAYTIIASLTWNLPDQPNYAILRRYAEELEVLMRGIQGTEEVETFGEPNEEILVEISAPSLVAVGLSPQALSEQVALNDAKVSAGRLRTPEQDVAIEVESELETLEQIRRIPIQSDSGQFTRLGDIAQVHRGIRQPPTDLVLVSGKPAIVLGSLMKSGLRIDRWATDVRQELDTFRDRLPQGMSLDVIFDQSNYVEDRISTLISNLSLGAGLVMAEHLAVMAKMVLMFQQVEVEVELFVVAVVLHSAVLSLSIGVLI